MVFKRSTFDVSITLYLINQLFIPADPLCGVKHRARRADPSTGLPRTSVANPVKDTPENAEKSEKLLRERSIRSNRRHKFVDCLSSQDVNIGTSLAAHIFSA